MRRYVSGSSAQRRVKFFLEHEAGYCAEVFFYYTICAGAVQITNTIAQRGEPIFFVSRNRSLIELADEARPVAGFVVCRVAAGIRLASAAFGREVSPAARLADNAMIAI